MATKRDRGGVGQAISKKGIFTKNPGSRPPFSGRTGQASSPPISEDGNNKELLDSICQLHRQIRADHTPAKDIKSAIGKLKTEIKNLLFELDDSEENTEAPPKHTRSTHDERKPALSGTKLKTTASGTNNSNDLYTVATTTSKRCRKLNMDLVKTRNELKRISELAVAVGQEVGFQPDTSNPDKDKDSLSLSAKEALEDIKQRNKALSEELNKLSKKLEIYSTDQAEQQPKQHNDKNQQPNRTQQQALTTNQAKKKKDLSEEKKKHKSSQIDTNLEIISKAVSSFDDLQQYKGELKEISELAIAVGQEVGFMPATSNAGKDKDSLSVNAKEALEDIKQRNRALSEELNDLSKKLEIYSTDQTKQQPKQRNDKNQQPQETNQAKKKNYQSEDKKDHKSSQFDTNLEIITKAVRSFDDLQHYKGELKEISELAIAVGQEVGFMPDTSNAGKDKDSLSINAKEALEDIKQRNRQMNPLVQRTIRLCMREEDNLSKGESVFVQLERAVKDIDVDLQEFRRLKSEYRAFEANMSQVLAFAMDLEELIGPKEGSGTFNPSFVKEEKNKKDKGRSKKEEEGHDGSNADPPVGFDNRKFAQALQLLPKVYKIVKDELNKMDQLAKRTIHLAMKEGHQPITDKTLLSQLERAIEDIEGDFKKLHHLETKNRDEIQKLKREIELKVKEKEALHNRLSKLAGNKMTEGNPNIANLGDPNRPTKIAEIYSEIYDNEWTDALDICQKMLKKEYSEDDALQALNKTLIFCYKICQEKSDEWVEKTKGVLKRCSDELRVDIQSEEILMQIIDGRKAVSDQMSKQLLKEIRPNNDLKVPKYSKEMNSKLDKTIIQNKFFEKCFTLCWKMIVQNPRMILVEGPSRGNTYDRTIFREFTSSGSKVVFTVWPALYLHEGGPLLVKGVVKVE